MVTLHEVITFLVSMQISISSLQTHNVNRCGRSRHLARKLSLRRKRSSLQTAGQYFTNDQIKEMTRKVSAEVDLVHQQTQNQRYGSSHIGATAKDISNVVTDAASGVVDIFHGIDKAVAD